MAPSRGIYQVDHRLISQQSFIYRRCLLRGFGSNSSWQSGHNRWSKIKHDKAKVDAGKNRQRSIFAQELATASKLFGADPNMNPRLADLITKAKKEGFAKASIEAAIARGQGRSVSGASLESVTVEAMLPNNVGCMLDCETDNKLRTLAEVRLTVKENGGTTTPTSFLFTKKGKVTFERKNATGPEEMLESALEAGAIDISEDEDGRIVVWTEPGETKAIGETLSTAMDVQIINAEVVWDPNEETKVGLPNDKVAEELGDFLDELQAKDAGVQSIAMNVSQGNLTAEGWNALRVRLNA